MRKLAGFILTPIFYSCFLLCLCIFHPIQWLSLKLGGYAAHKKSVDILNAFLVACNYTLFNRTTFINNQNLPVGRPIIFVANHQSSFDIPPLIFFLRKFHGKFISKIELAKAGIPSISFNLVHGGAANIDRKDPKQSISEILQLANNMKTKNWSAFIFPEGTRTRNGKMKPFSVGGIATLLKKNPDALIVIILYVSFIQKNVIKLIYKILFERYVCVCVCDFIFIYFYLLNNSKINIIIKIMLDNAGSGGAFPCGTDVSHCVAGKKTTSTPVCFDLSRLCVAPA